MAGKKKKKTERENVQGWNADVISQIQPDTEYINVIFLKSEIPLNAIYNYTVGKVIGILSRFHESNATQKWSYNYISVLYV